MRAVLTVMAFLVASLFIDQTVRAAPLLKEKLLVCLKSAEAHSSALTVPEEIKKLAEGLRSLNPSLRALSLSGMVDHESAELDAIKTGIVQPNQVDALVDTCEKYTKSLLAAMNNTECGEQLLEQTNSNYEGIMEGHDKLEVLIGYAKVCVAAL